MLDKDVTLGDTYYSILPFALLQLTTLVIFMLFPQRSPWLPEVLIGKELPSYKRRNFKNTSTHATGDGLIMCGETGVQRVNLCQFPVTVPGWHLRP